jgi:hypothetical protein
VDIAGFPVFRGRGQGASPGELRAADTDRERVVTVLREAAADGRLTLDELEERTAAAYRARTLGELVALTADLLPPERQPLDIDPRPMLAFFRSGARGGRWVVPAQYPVTAICANVTLDLCEALLQTHRVSVQATVVAGTLTLIVPEGVRVEMPASAVLADKRDRLPPASSENAPVIEIAGFVSLGKIVVKPPKKPRRGLFRR